MICAIYRSKKKLGAYLYLEKRDDFSKLPTELNQIFGRPEFAMMLNLADRAKLAHADINKVKDALKNDGYYLQLPPPITEKFLKSENYKL